MANGGSMTEVGDELPLHNLLGIRIVEMGNGSSRVELPAGEYARGLVAPLHGGVVATLVDVACACALADLYDLAEEIPVSTDVEVKYFAQPRSWPVTATGRLVNKGRQRIWAECDLHDAQGRHLARGAGTYVLVKGFGAPA